MRARAEVPANGAPRERELVENLLQNYASLSISEALEMREPPEM